MHRNRCSGWVIGCVVLLLLVSACQGGTSSQEPEVGSPPDDYPKVDREAQREYFFERIIRIDDIGDGSFDLSFELSARVHRIDPVRSPNAAELVEFARAALKSGRGVFVTIETTGTATKKIPPTEDESKGLMPVILRLADTPDPDARDL